jgi:hypothetical protein
LIERSLLDFDIEATADLRVIEVLYGYFNTLFSGEGNSSVPFRKTILVLVYLYLLLACV